MLFSSVRQLKMKKKSIQDPWIEQQKMLNLNKTVQKKMAPTYAYGHAKDDPEKSYLKKFHHIVKN